MSLDNDLQSASLVTGWPDRPHRQKGRPKKARCQGLMGLIFQ